MVVNIESNINGKREKWEISTPLINTVLELIRATYEDDEVVEIINPTDCNNLSRVSEFFEYILKYPKDVKIPKVIVKDNKDIKESNVQNNPLGSDIVCFSGGIDSTAALLYQMEQNKNSIALWCDYGQTYKEPERKAVREICEKLSIPLYEATVDLSELIVLGTERFKHVFPARNLLIAAIAVSLNPQEVILAGLSDELIVPDKSPRMYSEGSTYLKHKVYSPFMKMTKAEVLSVWKKKWNNILTVDETVSCYSNAGDCQDCSSCAKREVAKIASKYSSEFPKVFTNQAELISNHWFSRIDKFDNPRRDEILISLNELFYKITPDLQEKVKFYLDKYYDEVKEWQKHLDSLSTVIDEEQNE
ncbi:MAG: 7-cyano-7-deazaguanine synthase [Bacilli bacterium]|nr:7-cyano-7-deazaguanine synthase [Bacilli bacterium]